MTSNLFLLFSLCAAILMTSTYAQCNTSVCNTTTTHVFTTLANTTVPFYNFTTAHFSNLTTTATISTTTGKPAQSGTFNVNYSLAFIAAFFAILFLK